MKFLTLGLLLTLTANVYATSSTSCYSKSTNKKVELEQGSDGTVVALSVLSKQKTLVTFKSEQIKKIGNSQTVIHAEQDVANSLTLVIGDEFREGAYTSSLHLLLDGDTSIEELVCTDESLDLE